MTPPPVVRITAWKMRWLLRKHNILQKLKRGELIANVTRSVPAVPEAGQLPGTSSQRIEYRDSNNQTVAVLHQYLHFDRSLGASGKPDPKQLIINGIIYHQPKQKQKLSAHQKCEAVLLRCLLPVIYFFDDHIVYIKFNY